MVSARPAPIVAVSSVAMTARQPDLAEHVALVSGANHGIGAATARLLADHGAAVLITYLRTEASGQYPEPYRASRRLDGHDVAASIHRDGGRAQAVEADLMDVSAIPRLFAEAEATFGPVDILVDNATGHCAHPLCQAVVRHLPADNY